MQKEREAPPPPFVLFEDKTILGFMFKLIIFDTQVKGGGGHKNPQFGSQ